MYFTALDIGSFQIKALVAETKKNGQWSILRFFQIPSRGLKKGEIIDAEEIVSSLKEIFEKIKSLDKSALKNIFVGVGGANVKARNSKGIVAVSRADNEISQDDIDRVIKASQAIKLSSNRMILHTVTREFIIDGVPDIRDPLGMNGTRLEVDSLVIDAFSPNIKSILNIVESLGGSVAGLIYNPLAASRAILTKNQKDLGVVLIDIGFGATTMSVYEDGKLLHAAGFPVGSANITNDLAIGLKCSIKAAELIKIFFGCAKTSEALKEKITPEIIKKKSGVNIYEFDKHFKSIFSGRDIAHIIESRLTEIFEFVNNELKVIGKSGRLPAGAIICGGAVKMPNIVDLVKDELKLTADIGFPIITNEERIGELEILLNDDVGNDISHSEFSVVLGLSLMAYDQYVKTGEMPKTDKFSSIKKIFKYFLP
ncbi:cell division protein FtsA [Candidatus Wolfebacteria bacterium]|nr:cell division protein FtsA [Candidatus Wolfebacteria bacterium]